MLPNLAQGTGRAPLQGRDEISLPQSAVLVFKHPSVGPLYIHSGATAIQWAYHLNTVSTPTIGGEVVQILSAFVGPMTIRGQAAGLLTGQNRDPASAGFKRGWGDHTLDRQQEKLMRGSSYNPNDELKAIMDWFREYMTLAGSDTRGNQRRDERAIKFIYPERGWDFYLQVTKLDGFRYDRAVIAPEWSITAEIVSDNALNYFRGATMSSFTDDLIVNQELLGRIGKSAFGLSAFADSKTERDNPNFGQTGGRGSTNPFLNPELGQAASELARKMGDNFQGLLAAWNTGSFGHFGFGALLDNGALPKDVDAAYQSIFGSSFLGNLPGVTSGSQGSGRVTYNGPANPGTRDQIILDIATSFETYNIPGKLGVAVAMNESGLNPDRTQQNCNGPSCGIGLFQTNGDGSGRDSRAMVRLAGQNRVPNSERGNITPYYPAGEQISAAAKWFNEYAHSGSPSVDFMSASNEQLALLAFNAQGASDPNYQAKILSLLPEAQKLIRNSNASVNNIGTVPTGSLQNLAKQLLGTYGTQWIDINGQGKAQITKVANGERLTNQLGVAVDLEPRTIQVVLGLIGRGYTIGTYSWCEDHGDDGPNGHVGGKAVDISSINGVAINADSNEAHDLTLEIAKILRNTRAPLTPRQLICGGYGFKRSADISSQCIPGPYNAQTMQDHTNHIHVGF